ncbi:hypothetical protein D3C84_706150 [compost metagenome]
MFHCTTAVQQTGGNGAAQQQPDSAGDQAQLQGREGQGAVGHKVTLAHQNRAGDREHQHEGQGDQRINCARSQAVLGEKRQYRDIHEQPSASGEKSKAGPVSRGLHQVGGE